MSTYELLTIHSPLLTEDQYLEQMTRLKDVVTRNGGEIVKEDIWGRRRLAYIIEKQREGQYSILHFEASPDSLCLAELDRFCKIEETVLRHLVTRAVLDKSLGTPPEAREFAEEGEGRPGRGRYGADSEGRGGRYRRDDRPQTEGEPTQQAAENAPEAPSEASEETDKTEPDAVAPANSTDSPQ